MYIPLLLTWSVSCNLVTWPHLFIWEAKKCSPRSGMCPAKNKGFLIEEDRRVDLRRSLVPAIPYQSTRQGISFPFYR